MARFTLAHVILSLDGIFSRFVVRAVVTGFFFPLYRFLPSHAVGIVSLVVLVAAFSACYTSRAPGLASI